MSYESVYLKFQTWFPVIASQTVEWYMHSDFDLVAVMSDGSRILYDDFWQTIRKLPKIETEEQYRIEFGRRLRALMDRKQITQGTLSEMIDIPQSRISEYMNGKHMPSAFVVDKIAKAIGCSKDDIMI